jgi:hypothetical protein
MSDIPVSLVAEGLSDREALRRYRGYIRPGELSTWRAMAAEDPPNPVQWIGRPIESWKVKSAYATPGDEGEWRTSATDLKEIVEAMKTALRAAGKWTDPATGRVYLTLRAFRELTGMAEQQVSDYREDRPGALSHSALGRPIKCKKARVPAKRNRWRTNYVFLEEDGNKIAAWKEARDEKRGNAEAFLRRALSKGWRWSAEVKQEALAAGIITKTCDGPLKRARKALGVKHRKNGLRGPSAWWLHGDGPPDNARPPAIAEQPANDEASQPAGTTTPNHLSAVERAIQIFLRDTSQSVREIARKVGCNHALLSRNEKFRRLRQAYQGSPPRGTKSRDGNLEAEAED